MMGSGKTTIGKRLAERLGRPFADTDAIIEARTGLKIRELFDREGELAFRERERALIGEFADYRGYVLALGGGMFVGDANVEAIRLVALTIWLRAGPKALSERLRIYDLGSRPLLSGDVTSTESEIAFMLGKRAHWYAQAHYVFDTDLMQPVVEIAEAIAKMLGAPCA